MRYFNLKIFTDDKGNPTIKFYDAMYAGDERFGELGQFTGGRYYLKTLLEDRERLIANGLCLYGSEPLWNVTGHQMRFVFEFIDAWIAKEKRKEGALA